MTIIQDYELIPHATPLSAGRGSLASLTAMSTGHVDIQLLHNFVNELNFDHPLASKRTLFNASVSPARPGLRMITRPVPKIYDALRTHCRGRHEDRTPEATHLLANGGGVGTRQQGRVLPRGAGRQWEGRGAALYDCLLDHQT